MVTELKYIKSEISEKNNKEFAEYSYNGFSMLNKMEN